MPAPWATWLVKDLALKNAGYAEYNSLVVVHNHSIKSKSERVSLGSQDATLRASKINCFAQGDHSFPAGVRNYDIKREL